MRPDVQPGAWLAAAAGYVPSAMRRLPRGEEVRLAPELRERWGDLKGTPVRMRSRAWRNEVVGWFRASFMDGGARVRVMSCLSLPRDAFDLPMFAAEVVEVHGALRVVAFDWIPTGAARGYTQRLAPTRARFAHFPGGGELPPWAAEAFSPQALFSRPGAAVAPGEVVQAFASYLDEYLELVAEAEARGDSAANRVSRRAYCDAHAENDPGGRMLEAIFGETWATAYAEEFLFRLDHE